MALQVPLANDKKRVKVYELRDNDWFDRGTGFCTGQILNVSASRTILTWLLALWDTRLFDYLLDFVDYS